MCVETSEGNNCDAHEQCSMSDCVALKNPVTLQEYKDTLEHWRDHICFGSPDVRLD